MQLAGKTAFLTGGVGGLGQVFTRALLEKGCKVCITDVNEGQGKKVEGELREKYGDDVAFIRCDVTDAKNMEDFTVNRSTIEWRRKKNPKILPQKSEDFTFGKHRNNMNNLTEVFKAAVARFGNVDIMLNNAGILNEGRWEDMISVMLRGTVIGTDLAIAHMRKDKGGKGGIIINSASGAGVNVYFAQPIYCACKSGIVAHTRAWSKIPDREEVGIQFACLCPRSTDTPLMELTPEKVNYYEYEVEAERRMGKMKPEYVAEGLISLLEEDDCNGAIFYISKDQGYVRKKILVVDESVLDLA